MLERYRNEPYKREPYLEGAWEVASVLLGGMPICEGWSCPRDGRLVPHADVTKLLEVLSCSRDSFAPTAAALN